MAVIRIERFLGENRAVNAKLLSPDVGVHSRNQKPGRGDLRGWKQPVTVATVPAGRVSIYRMGRDSTDETRYWHSWTTRVHAVRGYNVDDTTERTYYTGSGAPKVMSNLSMGGTGTQDNPVAPRLLGVPAPDTVLTATVAGGTSNATMVTYFYAYTYVDSRGQEGGPSGPSTKVERRIDGTTTLTGFAAPPSGYENIDKVRIYRTETVSSSSAPFFLMAEVAYTNGMSVVDDNQPLQEELATIDYALPPDDLSHLTAMWNGMLAGISGNAVCFCEPYTVYSWPTKYQVTPPDAKPVGLGVFGQQLLVLTTGQPLLMGGSTPDSMDQQPLEIPQACVAPASIVSMGSGVAWASNDGLCFYGTGGARILTAGILTREDWQALKPATITGSFYEGLYFGSYDDGSGRKGFIVDPANTAGIYFLDTGYSGAYFDKHLDQLYVLDGSSVKKWDAGTQFSVAYKTKVFQLPRPMSFACAEIPAGAYPLTLRVTADGTTREYTVPSANPIRLHSGFLATTWQFEVVAPGAVEPFSIATSMEELAQV